MPGVVMLEAVAQLSSYFTQKHDLLGSEMVGFGGLDSVRFRGVVSPGDRLILLVKMVKTRRGRMIVADFQGIVKFCPISLVSYIMCLLCTHQVGWGILSTIIHHEISCSQKFSKAMPLFG